jgi:hypothetical protein
MIILHLQLPNSYYQVDPDIHTARSITGSPGKARRPTVMVTRKYEARTDLGWDGETRYKKFGRPRIAVFL